MEPEFVHNQTDGRHAADRSAKTTTQSCSENDLKFICKLKCDLGPLHSSADDHPSIHVDCECVSVIVPAQCSVYQLRLRLCMQVQEQKCHPDPLSLLDPKKHCLLYSRGEDWYEVYDDCQIIKTLDIPLSYDDVGLPAAHIVVQPPPVDSEEKQKQQQFLAYLIGHDLAKEAPDRLSELTFTRRKLASPRKQALRTRDDVLYATEPWVTKAPVPNELQPQLKRKLPVNLHYMNEISFSIDVDFSATPKVLLQIFRKVMADQKSDEVIPNRLVLKVSGREEFLSGDHPLRDFLWVRQCLKTNQHLHLSVVPLSQLPKETATLEDWPLVDAFSGQFSSHEDLCLDGKDVEDIFMISLWDCKRPLRVKLLGVDIPKLPSTCPQCVYVQASILYGMKVLSSVSSVPKAFTDEILWNEWLEFDLLLRDLPRGAKLGFTVNASGSDGATVSKDPKMRKEKGEVLYFVNLLLIDHRSVLSQGSYTLHMWSYRHGEKEAVTYQADKLSSATNTDVSESMAISFLLDHHSFPVVLPNCLSSQSSSTFSPTESPKPPSSSSCPSTSASRDPSSLHPLQDQSHDTVTFRSTSSVYNTDQASLRRFREESVRYASNLPHFLRKVKWKKRAEVEDVHWLLGNWDPGDLDLTVALELLSMDFVDEMVRRLAVQRLESLSNDDVLKYLLQLVQTLKVEPYHDSFLARYLIQRALQSKRIGHFFFWYVRSEVSGCPYFRQRMAVILESYLMGCSWTLLHSFRQQVQAVEALHKVDTAIKRLYPDKDLCPAAPLRLQELLRNSDLPDEFLLPFDPRIKVGRILLEKCKVMASKKKPLWLEFSAVSSPTPASPVGIIFKQGDDLRQDMLIIQTLALMDSIWQEKSLDLHLIPYGCIATGHNIGMIEVVRDAVTIAAIQKSRGGSIKTFLQDALFDWLKSKCPLQEMHYMTVDRFVKSCAGYCVATYVLGIGDRHNDNIMVTDQGNLFHIDFGHILGNTKHFLGVNRERVPFVLTPDFLYVMGRERGRKSLYFQCFKDTCIQAYLSLRVHSRLLITLFSLMLLTGIPELSAAEDMCYLREALQQNSSELQAKQHLLQQITVCEEQGWKVQTNWWIHRMGGAK